MAAMPTTGQLIYSMEILHHGSGSIHDPMLGVWILPASTAQKTPLFNFIFQRKQQLKQYYNTMKIELIVDPLR